MMKYWYHGTFDRDFHEPRLRECLSFSCARASASHSYVDAPIANCRRVETLRVSVAGCSGFQGRCVAEAMSREGHDVIGLDLDEPSWELADFGGRDFTSKADAVEGQRGASLVCHLGGVG